MSEAHVWVDPTLAGASCWRCGKPTYPDPQDPTLRACPDECPSAPARVSDAELHPDFRAFAAREAERRAHAATTDARALLAARSAQADAREEELNGRAARLDQREAELAARTKLLSCWLAVLALRLDVLLTIRARLRRELAALRRIVEGE